MNKAASDVIYLLACTVNGLTPDKARVQAMDLEKLYKFCKWHTLRAALYTALAAAGVQDEIFYQAYNKAICKNVLLDVERASLFGEFEQQGIWYMPLKGSVLKDMYPENGMREMADNDVLYDAEKQAEVKQIMLGRGYTAKSVGKTHHDVYMKPPVMNFELHTLLFAPANPFYSYFLDVKRRLLPDEDKKYGFHFSDEDFYVYFLAHEYKHFSGGGTGLRSLLDCYVYLQHKGVTLDWAYIAEQTEQLGIADFERGQRELAKKVFSSDTLPSLTAQEQELLDNFLNYGTYGTLDKLAVKFLPEQSNFKNILHNMFPPLSYMKIAVKFVGKYPFLYPVGIVYRWGRILLIRRKHLFALIRVMKKHDQKKV